MSSRLAPLLLLAALGLAFFAPLVLHPTQTLYADHSDFFVQHLPAKHFLVRSWQEDGELPLWCPYSFAGMPFVHDPHVGLFYPPNWVLLLVPPGRVGAATSWLVVAHVLVAGWCAYAYARGQQLGVFASLVTAAGYMFAGKTLLHVLGGGHVLAGLAWLPLVLLWQERALRGKSLWWATAAGTAYALVVLGTHPQFTLYSGLFVALWTLGPAFEAAGPRRRGRTLAALRRWAACGAWLLLVAVGLAAVQLLPGAEGARQTTRGVLGAPPVRWLPEAASAVAGLVGPSPLGPAWEHRSGVGALWLAAAAMAPMLGLRRSRFYAGVAAVLLLYALGGAALQGVPGLSAFRLPARALVLLALPVALLAGSTTQALLDGVVAESEAWGRARLLLLAAAAVALLSALADWLLHGRPALRPPLYWSVMFVTVSTALFLLGRTPQGAPRPWAAAWAGLLLADLWTLAGPSVAVRPEAEVYPASACVDVVAGPPGKFRVLDRDVPDRPAESPLGIAVPVLREVEPVRGYNSFDYHRYKEYVRLIADGDQSVAGFEGIFNFPVKNKPLLDLLGVRYVLQPASEGPAVVGTVARETDPHPAAYCFIAGGVCDLPPYRVYENPDALPRAFVVPEAAPLPAGSRLLPTLKTTDFRRTVLLEGVEPAKAGTAEGGTFRAAEVREYRPNRVVIDAESDVAGYLVLADLWYPGWECTVDGEAVPVRRANYVFRAVELPAGRHEVVFRFKPESYRLGRWVSATALAVVAAVGLVALARAVLRR
jgi:hypothetical protein